MIVVDPSAVHCTKVVALAAERRVRVREPWYDPKTGRGRWLLSAIGPGERP